MKKTIQILLIALIAILLISCKKVDNSGQNNDGTTNNGSNADNGSGNNQNNDQDEIVYLNYDFENYEHIISDAIKNYDLSYDPTIGSKIKEEVLDIIDKKLGCAELEKAIEKLDSHYADIMDLLAIAETLSYAYYMTEEVQTEYNDLYAYYLDLQTLYMELDVEIAKSDYASEYFSDLSPDEIEELANTEVDNEELNALLVRKNEISNTYYSVDNRYELLAEFVNINKRIAEINGYGHYGYVQYSDECEYGRQYSASDVEELMGYILEYLYELEDEVYSLYLSTNNQEEKDLLYKHRFNTIADNREMFDEYVNAVGSTYKDCYYDLWDHGYYVIASGEDAYPTAFQDSYNDVVTIYIGPYYNDISTFVHEFGHYHTAVYDHDYFSYDLLETHSQGSEVLLRLYLLENHPGYSSAAYEKELVENLLYGIVAGAMLREYETTLYSTEVQDIKALWDSIIDKYGYDGWQNNEGMIIFYDNYYFSYATSAIAALMIYVYGKQNGFEAARDVYLSICNYDGTGDLVEALASVGFASPFEEGTVKYIHDVIVDTMENEWSDYIE